MFVATLRARGPHHEHKAFAVIPAGPNGTILSFRTRRIGPLFVIPNPPHFGGVRNLLLSFLLASSIVIPSEAEGPTFFRRQGTVSTVPLPAQKKLSSRTEAGRFFLARVFVRGLRREGPAFSFCHPEPARAVCERG